MDYEILAERRIFRGYLNIMFLTGIRMQIKLIVQIKEKKSAFICVNQRPISFVSKSK